MEESTSSSVRNCLLGAFLKENCQYDPLTLHMLDDDEQSILQLRSGCDSSVVSVCSLHWQIFFEFYSLRQHICCDPFGRHKKKINRALRVITLEMARLYHELGLTPGKKLCPTCRAKLPWGKKSKSKVQTEQNNETSSIAGKYSYH